MSAWRFRLSVLIFFFFLKRDREKINALYSAPKQGGSKVSVAANNRSLSNGMKASVDTGGKLVWD